MEKFQGKYRITSARLRNWNYASNGMYFVTLCTKNKENYFGQIIKPEINKEHFEMRLSEIGKIVESEWLKTPDIRHDMNLELGEYQVMPNHFHAILIIGENQFNTKELNQYTNNNINAPDRDTMPRVSIELDPESVPNPEIKTNIYPEFENDLLDASNLNLSCKNKFAPQSKNLGSIMRGFKSAVTMFALDNKIVFGWQTRFYDHIIRDYDEYQRIANYIRNNPDNWENDKFR
jgi:REP element-mobilizing transposase RayT